MSQASSKIRLYILAFVVIAVTAVFSVRLYMLQVVHGEAFRERAQQQYTRSSSGVNERGSIALTTKDGSRRLAAFQESGFELAVNGQVISDPQQAYTKLKPVVSLNKQDFVSQVTGTDDPYIVIKERLSSEVGQRIRDLDIEGVGVYPQKWRRYPLGDLAAHTIGFVGFTEDNPYPTGLYGTEKYRNDILRRSPGGVYVNFFAQVFSQSGKTAESNIGSQAGDVNLTLEPDVQAFLEKQLKDISNKWDSRQTMGVVIEPDTGKIRALGVHPSYNPNTYGQVENSSVFTNPVVRSRFEMGSVVKALTMAAGLDAGVVTPETTYDDTGSVTINESTIENYDGVGRGPNTTMQTVLNESLNTGAAFVAEQLGHKQMRSYFQDWFRQKTGIDLPGEIGNDISNLKVDRDLEYATAAFGQGIALTPIATVRALATLANGGQIVRPHVTQSIEYQLGGKDVIKTQKGKRVISEEAADTISRMLVNVVDEGFEDSARPRHSIAAKTGTAQVSKPGGGYYEDQFNHTFFGYFPAYEPEYLVFLMTRRPKDVRFSSQTLKDPFMRITDFLINYYNIPPDR